MENTERFQELFSNPNSYTNEYERGIVHGMAFLAEKLIWAEQLYLDALESNHKNEKEYDYNKNIGTDLHQVVNKIYQDFATRSHSFELFQNKELETWYNDIREKLNLNIGKLF